MFGCNFKASDGYAVGEPGAEVVPDIVYRQTTEALAPHCPPITSSRSDVEESVAGVQSHTDDSNAAQLSPQPIGPRPGDISPACAFAHTHPYTIGMGNKQPRWRVLTIQGNGNNL